LGSLKVFVAGQSDAERRVTGTGLAISDCLAEALAIDTMTGKPIQGHQAHLHGCVAAQSFEQRRFDLGLVQSVT
jgi:hypothetical protein